MRIIYLIVLLVSVGCSFYVIKEFKLPENNKPINEHGWEIKPYISEQTSFDEYKNRYSCSISISLYTDLFSGAYRNSDYDVRMENMRILLPDTTYPYTPSDCYSTNDTNEKKLYDYELRRSTEKDVQKLPYIGKEENKIVVECDILYISKSDSTTQKRQYSFNMVRRNKQGMSSFFLK